jgi:hypothetical protein
MRRLHPDVRREAGIESAAREIGGMRGAAEAMGDHCDRRHIALDQKKLQSDEGFG